MLVSGPVYIPREVDTQGEGAVAEQIEEAAHDWFRSGSATKVDTEHNDIPNGCIIVESYIVRESHPHPDYPPGTWMAVTEIRSDATKADVREGRLNGYSFKGDVERTIHLALIRHPVAGSGTTEKSESGPYPEHEHAAQIQFDTDGKVVPTVTDETFAHKHSVIGTTRTELEMGHAHGIRLVPEY
jgi:hypothetical protein